MLSDTTRVRLLWALIDQELAVNELATRVDKPAPSVSQHLAKLRMARLVRTRRKGTQVFYRLENEHVAQLVRDGVYNAEHAGPGVPRHHVDGGVAPLASVPRSRSGGQGSTGSGTSQRAEQGHAPAPSPRHSNHKPTAIEGRHT